METNQFLTVKEVAKILKLSQPTNPLFLKWGLSGDSEGEATKNGLELNFCIACKPLSVLVHMAGVEPERWGTIGG